MEKIDQKSEGELILDWGKECESKSDKKGGPGGQNANKVNSAWSMRHKYLFVRVKMGDGRDQFKNREEAEKRMAELINKHIDIWLEKLTSVSGDWKEIILDSLRESYIALLDSKRIHGEDKMGVLDVTCKKVLGIKEKN